MPHIFSATLFAQYLVSQLAAHTEAQQGTPCSVLLTSLRHRECHHIFSATLFAQYLVSQSYYNTTIDSPRNKELLIDDLYVQSFFEQLPSTKHARCAIFTFLQKNRAELL